MILYLDTSAMVKLFAEEEHTSRVRRAVSEARLVIVHSIAYAEACAAFARFAFLRQDDALLPALRAALDVQWKAWEVLAAAEPLIRRAADLSGRFQLRGYDSLHFAAAEAAFDIFRGRATYAFAVFDNQLRDAASRAGIPLLDT